MVGRRLLVLVFLMVAAGWAERASGQTLTIAWDPNPDPSVVGYIVYSGTQSGEYTAKFNVGTATSFTYGVEAEKPYFFAVASYSGGMLVGPLSAEVVGTVHTTIERPAAAPVSNTTSPVITVTLLSSQRPDEFFVVVGGIATGDSVVAVRWENGRSGIGKATGTEMWIAGIPLHAGRNTITITAFDETGNAGTATIEIYR